MIQFLHVTEATIIAFVAGVFIGHWILFPLIVRGWEKMKQWVKGKL